MTDSFRVTSIDVDLPILRQRELVFSDDADGGNLSTIIVGRNGSGKSTILRDITMALRSYFSTHKLRSRQGINRVSRIKTVSDGRPSTLDISAETDDFTRERDRLRTSKSGPSRLIALSFTPFDKFPPVDETRGEDREWLPDPFYVYLGHKTEFVHSPRSRLMRSIDNLVHANPGPAERQRIIGAFRTLGYEPIIELRYQRQASGGRSRDPNFEQVRDRFLSHLSSRDDRRLGLNYKIDFAGGPGAVESPQDYERIREAARYQLARLASVTLHRINGETAEMLELSSGELNLLSGFLGLAAYLQDGSLVLIDEPENSLHPQWQIDYVGKLGQFLRQYKGCHYIIATHSPLIVSGLSGNGSKVLRLDQHAIALDGDIVADASPDATLMNAFQVVTLGNNHLKQVVLEALAHLETGAQDDQRAIELAAYLQRFRPSIPDNDPIRPLVTDVVEAILAR